MLVKDNDLESAIASLIGESSRDEIDSEPSRVSHSSYQVRNILLVSTPYDYFLLEEEGRLSELFKQVYIKRDVGYIPLITQVKSARQALSTLDESQVDLLVMFNFPRDMDPISFGQEIRKRKPSLPLVLLANNTSELQRMIQKENGKVFDWVFTWQGDGKIFLSIVSLAEDMKNAKSDASEFAVRHLLLAEHSVQWYSQYLPLFYDEIWHHIDALNIDELTPTQRRLRQKRRPKVLLATSAHQAQNLFSLYKDRLLCIVSSEDNDETSKTNYVSFTGSIHEKSPDLPLLILSNRSAKHAKDSTNNTFYLYRQSPDHVSSLQRFLRDTLGINEVVFVDSQNREQGRARDMKSFERAIWSLPEEVLVTYAHNKTLTRWLIARTEFELASAFERIIQDLSSKEKTTNNYGRMLQKELLQAFKRHQYLTHQGTITTYSREMFGPHVRFCRIGGGALGGKARALAFMDKVLSTYFKESTFKGVTIFIPRTVVLGTDVFDSFLSQNTLLKKLSLNMPDDRIASLFMQSDLPSTVLGDLRDFIKDVRIPLAVRSSSLLEDALFQPFAGVYSSLMLPNQSLEVDKRFRDLCNAIKFVYASTFFKKAQGYLRSTPNSVLDEKMGVIVQEVVGQQHGHFYYPTLSGVGRSYNYYPVGRCNNEDGVAHLALGMGKTIVDGGVSYRFCPAHPTIPHYSSLQDLMKDSQTAFYAIDLDASVHVSHQDEDRTFTQGDLAIAEKQGVLDYICSTFSRDDGKLYSGISPDGPRVIDFAPLLQDRAIPLAKIINILLKVCEISIGSPVEIEFAVNLDSEHCVPTEFALLQVRSMVTMDDIVKVDIDTFDKKNMVCYCERSLGNGIIHDVRDIIYVKQESFDLSKTAAVVPELRDFNTKLLSQKKPYILVGPGRWGSLDPWLGIPVVWSDIAGAKVIVETPVSERSIDPSEGSHFFQNLSSLRVGYLTIRSTGKDFFRYDLLDMLPVKDEGEYVKHVHVTTPLDIRLDGRLRHAVIILRDSKKR
jgi:hypothetical protein